LEHGIDAGERVDHHAAEARSRKPMSAGSSVSALPSRTVLLAIAMLSSNSRQLCSSD